MQGTGIRLFISGMLLATVGGNVQAEALQPDPAWQQGKLSNGFSWQVLTTPQRPNDRIELRLVVDAGSLGENAQQTGFARLLPRLALTHSENLSPASLESLWQPSQDGGTAQAPAVISYDSTLYSLSLPTGRPDLLRDALKWMANAGGHLIINPMTLHTALMAKDPVATVPADSGSAWWRYRLAGSTLLAHDPAQQPKVPVNGQQLQQFYQHWYTPDAMTLYVVGNVDNRSLNEQIGKAFSTLKGKRDMPAIMPTLSPLPPRPVSLMSDKLKEDSLKLVWDASWQPIRDSHALELYWRSDLAREALFMHVQQALRNSNLKQTNLRFDCNVHYQRAQCAMHLDTPSETLMPAMTLVARELANLRNNGLSKTEFDELMVRKTGELSTLFATYARTDTSVLINQRLRSQQNDVVDIAPEQYQKLRNGFLAELTLPMLNQELHTLLSQNATLILMQPQGEQEINMKSLQETYDHVLTPGPQPVAADESKPEVTDIPPQS